MSFKIDKKDPLKIMYSEEPATFNSSEFARVSIKQQNGNPYTIAITSLTFTPLDIKPKSFLNLTVECDPRQVEHLKAIYYRIQHEQPWHEHVEWKTLDKIQLQWPKEYKEQVATLQPLQAIVNGQTKMLTPEELLSIINADESYKINRADFEVKPWIRNDLVGGVAFKLKVLDVSV